MDWTQYLGVGVLCVLGLGCSDDEAPVGDGGGGGKLDAAVSDAGGRDEDGGGGKCDADLKLADFCDRRSCPESIDALREQVCKPGSFATRWRLNNDCGGETAISRIGNSIMIYSFDAGGRLVGVRSSDDVVFGECKRDVYVYGELCGEFPRFPGSEGREVLCEEADAGS